MVIRQRDDLTQIAVLEDKVLVEHYVARESQTSLIGNVYLGRVQNVLPSMEAAFIDIGKGRNAVLYAGEVNWSGLGHKDGQPRKIESVLSSGQTILVQVTKDPVGHKGARLTGQVSLPGRFLVYVPDGNTSGISRKLPDTERNRLKTLLKEIVPDTAGVIVRTAAEGASEDELTRRRRAADRPLERHRGEGQGRQGPAAAVRRARPDPQGGPRPVHRGLRQAGRPGRRRLGPGGRTTSPTWRPTCRSASSASSRARTTAKDVFASYRVDEQIAKGLDRKVWLPSGGSLIIDRTEAMTVVDVNTGKFTGSGGNLEETVTKNNLEAAEEIVRQLRLRDIGGIIVVDFIDMVLESNRDLVLRRLVECLGRDRTRHQVAEVTSLGLVQMTRKRIGTGLLEAFSTDCEHCKGRGVVIHDHPVEPGGRSDDDEPVGVAAAVAATAVAAAARGDDSGSGNGGGNGGGDELRQAVARRPGQQPPPGEDRQRRGTRTRGRAGARARPRVDEAPDEHGRRRSRELRARRRRRALRPRTAGPRAERADQPVIGKPPSPRTSPRRCLPSRRPRPAEPAGGRAAEPAAEQPAEPEAPRVVTSTRRRTARRPAGHRPVGARRPLPEPASRRRRPPSRSSPGRARSRAYPDPQQPEPVAEADPRADEEATTASTRSDVARTDDGADEPDEERAGLRQRVLAPARADQAQGVPQALMAGASRRRRPF